MSAAVASGPEGNEAKSGDAQLKPDSTKLARVPGSPIDLLYQSGFASLLSSTNQAGSIFTLDPKVCFPCCFFLFSHTHLLDVPFPLSLYLLHILGYYGFSSV